MSKATMQEAPKQETNWLISFGDLLTLLVCFFMALAQSGLSPTPKDGLKNKDLQALTTNKPEHKLDTNSGTTLAHPTYWGLSAVEYPTLIIETVLFSDDLTSGSRELSANGVKKLRAELPGYLAEAQRVEIEVCNSDLEGERAARSIRSVLGIRRVLVELGAKPGLTTLRAGASGCDELQFKSPVTEQVVGVVRLRKSSAT